MRKTKIVVPTMPQNLEEVESLQADAYFGADIIEWRADFLPVEEILVAAPKIFEKFQNFKILFTLRTAKEGGKMEISDKQYSQILQNISAYSPDFIDLEYFSHRQTLKLLDAFREKIVLSYHNFTEMPTDITERLVKMEKEKTAFVKVAVMPQRECDVLDLLQINRDLTLEYGYKFITIAMGCLGKLSRISGYLTGNCWTFASLKEASAPGQISLTDTQKILAILEK